MMFEGDEQTLCKTENTQPCLYLADLAPALMLAQNGVHPHGAAGFSLGELPALAFSGALSLKEGFALTVKRAFYGPSRKGTTRRYGGRCQAGKQRRRAGL